jgi:hypothetical protein
MIHPFKPLLEHGQPVLLQQEESSSKLAEASAQKVGLICRQECGETGISGSVILN